MNDTRSTNDRRRRSGRGARCAAMAALCALGAGCASGPPPRDLDLRGARIVPMASAPALDVSGLPGGKAVGAAVGAGTGSGVGVVGAVVSCLALGPLAPLCIVTVAPTVAAIGAVTGAVVGAVRTEAIEAMAQKTQVLKDELVATPYQTLLAQQLHASLRDGYSLDVSLDDTAVDTSDTPGAPTSGRTTAAPAPHSTVPLGADQPWHIEVGVIEVGTEGKSEFALRLVARLTLRRGNGAPVWQTAREVQSDTELTTAQWIANDSKALRGVLDRCVRQAARQLVSDLGPAAAGTPAAQAKRPARYSTSCLDVSQEWVAVAVKP